jgi:hypothetical protein
VSRVRGTDRHPDTYIAMLPHGYAVAYRVYPHGIVPHATPMLKVLHFERLADES